jgi:hypothetical protein
MVPVKIVVGPRYTSQAVGAIDSNCLWSLETLTRRNFDASVKRVQSEQSSYIAIGSLLDSCLERAGPDQVEAPSLPTTLCGRRGCEHVERVMVMTGVALSGAEASLAIVYFASDGVHFVTPVAMGFNNVVFYVREVERETCSSLDNNIASSIVCDLETPGDGIVLWENTVRKHGADIRHVIVELNLESSHICVVPVGRGKSRNGWLAGGDLVALVEERRYCIAIGVLNVDRGQANVAATYIRKLSPIVCLAVVPAPS